MFSVTRVVPDRIAKSQLPQNGFAQKMIHAQKQKMSQTNPRMAMTAKAAWRASLL